MRTSPEPGDGTSPEGAKFDVEAELADLTKGDAARTEIVRASLRRLAGGSPTPELREMAREVLAGRRRLRDVATSGAYSEALFENYTTFWRKIEQLPEEERRRLTESSATVLARLRAQLEDKKRR